MARQGGKTEHQLDQFEIEAGDLGTFLQKRASWDEPRRPDPVQLASYGSVLRRLGPVRRHSLCRAGFSRYKHLQCLALRGLGARTCPKPRFGDADGWMLDLMGLDALKRRHTVWLSGRNYPRYARQVSPNDETEGEAATPGSPRPAASRPALYLAAYRQMDINLQLEGRGHEPLSPGEEYALVPHENWSIVTCANMVVRLRRSHAPTSDR